MHCGNPLCLSLLACFFFFLTGLQLLWEKTIVENTIDEVRRKREARRWQARGARRGTPPTRQQPLRWSAELQDLTGKCTAGLDLDRAPASCLTCALPCCLGQVPPLWEEGKGPVSWGPSLV